LRYFAFNFWFQIQLAPLHRGRVYRLLRLQAVSAGGAVQVDPIKPMLKPPETKHLKLQCDELLSSFAFKFKLRR